MNQIVLMPLCVEAREVMMNSPKNKTMSDSPSMKVMQKSLNIIFNMLFLRKK
jgi:hypothetical protein